MLDILDAFIHPHQGFGNRWMSVELIFYVKTIIAFL